MPCFISIYLFFGGECIAKSGAGWKKRCPNTADTPDGRKGEASPTRSRDNTHGSSTVRSECEMGWRGAICMDEFYAGP